LLLVTDSSPTEWLAGFLARRERAHRESGGPLPVRIRGWALDLAGDPESEFDWYLHRVQGPILAPPRLMILERFDLALSQGKSAEGLEVRSALARWERAFHEDWLVATVPPVSLAAHHPYPGWLLFDFDLPSSLRSESPSSLDAQEGPFPADPLPRDRIQAILGKLDETSGPGNEAAFGAVYELLAGSLRGSGLDETFFHGADLVALQPYRPRLISWLRAFVQQDLDGWSSLFRSSARDALVACRLYLLLSDLDVDMAQRETFAGCDLGRWLCFLRAFGYEHLAVVAARMNREILTGMNLVHAPPLAFSRFRGADFSSADLYRIDLSHADLCETSFVRADLSRAHLKGADLRGADLRGADLSYACLELADLRGAVLEGANLDHCLDAHAQRSC